MKYRPAGRVEGDRGSAGQALNSLDTATAWLRRPRRNESSERQAQTGLLHSPRLDQTHGGGKQLRGRI